MVTFHWRDLSPAEGFTQIGCFTSGDSKITRIISTFGAPLARFARWSSTINLTSLFVNKELSCEIVVNLNVAIFSKLFLCLQYTWQTSCVSTIHAKTLDTCMLQTIVNTQF